MGMQLESVGDLRVLRVLFTVRETAEMLAMSRSRVYELMASGRLGSVKIGRSRRVPMAAIERFAADAVLEAQCTPLTAGLKTTLLDQRTGVHHGEIAAPDSGGR